MGPHVARERRDRKRYAMIWRLRGAAVPSDLPLLPGHMRTVTAAFALLAAACASAPPTPDSTLARTIALALLDRGARAWNRGDLEAFMSDYMNSPRTAYVTTNGVVHGKAAIRERYAPRFAPRPLRDSLAFENVEADPINNDAMHVIAWYKLMRGDSVIARGPTSLLVVRDGPRWVILKDHSS